MATAPHLLLPPSQLPLPSLAMAAPPPFGSLSTLHQAAAHSSLATLPQTATPIYLADWRGTADRGSGASSASTASNYTLPSQPLRPGAAVTLASPSQAAGPSTQAQGGEMYLSDLLKGQWAWLLVMIAFSMSQTSSTEI